MGEINIAISKKKFGFGLESMGSLDLKNIQHPVNGYRILTPSSGNPFFRKILQYTRNTSSRLGKYPKLNQNRPIYWWECIGIETVV